MIFQRIVQTEFMINVFYKMSSHTRPPVWELQGLLIVLLIFFQYRFGLHLRHQKTYSDLSWQQLFVDISSALICHVKDAIFVCIFTLSTQGLEVFALTRDDGLTYQPETFIMTHKHGATWLQDELLNRLLSDVYLTSEYSASVL